MNNLNLNLNKIKDNFNDEWWLVEKIGDQAVSRVRGYVPANYVEVIYSLNPNENEIPIDTIDFPIEIECDKRGIKY